MVSTLDRQKTTTAIAGSWGLFAALGLLMLGNGLLGTLLGIRSELEGFATAATGLIMASYYGGFLLGSRIAPRILERVGHIRVFAALASLASASPLVHSVFVTPAVWSAMRFVFGFSMAGLYIVAESWLNQAATNKTRGRLLSIYMLVLMGGLGAGQLFIGLAEPTGFRLFVLASLFVSLAVVPISLSQGRAPGFHAPESLQATALWRLAPLGVVAGLVVGVTSGALVGIGPVYAVRAGFSTGQVAWLMGAALLGSIVWQWPIGLASDHMPRRRAILLTTVIAAAVAATGAQVDGANLGLLSAVMFFFGGLTFPMYSLGLSHINDVISTDQAVMASSIYVFISGLGAIAGPLTAAAALDAVGPPGFWVLLAAAHGILGVFALYLVAAVDAPVSTEDQKPWRPFPARASAVLARVAKVRRPNGKNDSRR